VLSECPDVKAASPVIQRNDIRSVSDFYQSSGQILGPCEPQRHPLFAAGAGALDQHMDNAQKRRVIVLGDESRRVMFPDGRR